MVFPKWFFYRYNEQSWLTPNIPPGLLSRRVTFQFIVRLLAVIKTINKFHLKGRWLSDQPLNAFNTLV